VDHVGGDFEPYTEAIALPASFACVAIRFALIASYRYQTRYFLLVDG
jgi:hypothetical protein